MYLFSVFWTILVMFEPEHTRDGFGIPDLSSIHHLYSFGKRNQLLLDHLIGFGLRRAGLESARPKQAHWLGDKARARIKLKDSFPTAGGKASFFQQFALGRVQWRFAFINATCGQLTKIAIGSVPILTFQQDQRFTFTIQSREDHDRSGVTHDLAQHVHAGRLDHLLRGHPEDRTAIYDARRQDANAFLGFRFLATSRFPHAKNISETRQEWRLSLQS